MRIFILFLLLTATVFGTPVVGIENHNFVRIQNNNPLLPPPPVSDKAAEFELKDQYNKLFSVKFPKNKATVLVFGDREGAGQIESWVRPLVEKYADKIDIHGVAELSAVPGVGKPIVRRIMKSQVKYSVMLDWSGEVSKSYGYEKGKANLFVVDKDGNIVASGVGAATEAELEKIYREIKQVSKSLATFWFSFRVHASACFRQRSAAERQTKVWTLNQAKYLITFAHLLNSP